MKNISEEKKKRYALVISLLVLMICIVGSTYAYFAITATNNSITGKVGGSSLDLTVTKILPVDNDSEMIPQLEGGLDKAISEDYNCVDTNGKVVCQVYSATVTNLGSESVTLNGTISFTGIEAMPNLKWKLLTDSRTINSDTTSTTASTAETSFVEDLTLTTEETTKSKTYYFVFWIEETKELQTDNGEFRAIINFNSPNATSGVTSTITPEENEELEAGAYYTNGTFKSWSTLVEEGKVTETEIPDNAFASEEGSESEEILEKVIIPDGVTSIGNNAFQWCTGLTSITISDSVTSIGSYAFYNCSSLTTITIPDGVTSIGSYAFYNCSNLTSVTIPEGITSIDEAVFSGCSSLSLVILPSNLISIGSRAFENCSFEEIAIPSSVTDIADMEDIAFYGCSDLKTIYYSGSMETVDDYGQINWGAENATILPYSEAPAELLPQ